MDKYILNSGEYTKALDDILSRVHPENKQLEFVRDATTIYQDFISTLLIEEENKNKVPPREASFKGERMLLLLDQLFFLTPPSSINNKIINMLAVSTTLWVAQRKGSIWELTMLVNALSDFANSTKINGELEELYEVSLYTIFATSPYVKADNNKSDTQRPWRLLCLNHCIIATRTGNSSLMRSAYNRLLEYLPEEADAFFRLAMQKVSTEDYSSSIVNTVRTYYKRYCCNTIIADTDSTSVITTNPNTIH